ncbi:toxin [Streptomyces rochei]|uniref:toxin n=1 Tax=Streptomyces TaxID=1883 RepID=UPI000EE253F1|nr:MULTISPECIES: toxin [unclassified Streptomyces]MBD2818598.1 toxin [Streptomyces parvulus]MBJ6621845.1 toxin [Streptomyces sp. DHE17-7]NUV93925.1 toxin [Streptomyces sp. KAI 90]RIH61038.1 toxin [Streptomyces sp. SHP22-7]
MTDVRCLEIDEMLAIARAVNGTEHGVRDMARNHALIDGNKPTAWLAMRVFLWCNGVRAGAVPPSVSVGGPFVEEVAQDTIDVPAMAKSLATWFPVS